MATASNNVQVKVEYKGVNNAKRATDQATRGVQRFGKSAQNARSQVGALGGSIRQLASGDVMGGLKSLNGSLGAGLTSSATAAAAGVAAVGVAVGVAAVKITRLTIEINRLAAQADVAFGTSGKGLSRAFDLADQIGGVGAQNVTRFAGVLRLAGVNATVTTEQLRELTARATAAGKSGDEALTAFARAIETGRGRALASVGTYVDTSAAIQQYARELGVTSDQIDVVTQRQIALDAVLKSLNQTQERSATLYDQQDRALASLDNSFLALKVQIAASAGSATDAVDTVTALTRAFTALSDVVIRISRAAFGVLRFAIQQVMNVIAGLGVVIGALIQRDLGALRRGFDAIASVARDNFAEVKESIVQVGDAFAPVRAEARETAISVTNAFSTVTNASAQALRFLRSSEKQARDLERRRQRRRAAAARARARRANEERARQQKARDAARAVAEEQRFEAELLGLVVKELADEEKAAADARKKAADARKKDADERNAQFDNAIEQLRALQGELGALDSTAANALATLPALGAAAAQATKEGVENQVKATEIAGQALGGFVDAERARVDEQIRTEESAALATATTQEQRTQIQAEYEAKRAKNLEDSERRKAGILALVSAAQAALLFSQGQIPQAISAGVAAVGFAAIAGGAVQRVGGGAATSTGGGATTGAGATTTTATADAAPSTQGNVVVNFGAGFVIGTQQQVGQAIAGSLNSLKTTGLVTAGGV